MKRCPKCGDHKPFSEFNKNGHHKTGFQSYCRPCENAIHRKYQKSPKGKISGRNRQLRANFGITLADYEKMLLEQDGKCANSACRTSKPGGMGVFHVDHDHITKKVRGLLCQGCNRGMGYFKDSAEVLIGAAEYLRRAG